MPSLCWGAGGGAQLCALHPESCRTGQKAVAEGWLFTASRSPFNSTNVWEAPTSHVLGAWLRLEARVGVCITEPQRDMQCKLESK